MIEPTAAPYLDAPAVPGSDAASAELSVLVVRIGTQRVAVPGAGVERVLAMAELTFLPEPPRGIVGVLVVGGRTLPVVDPRPWWGLPTPRVHPDQHLVLVAGRRRFLLWVDQVEALVIVPVEQLDGMGAVARLADEAVPLLATDDLAPESLAPSVGSLQ